MLHSGQKWLSRNGHGGRLREEFLRLALSLAQGVPVERPRAVMLASAHRGEGTTTVALGVARELQRATGMRPLVVELNRQHPCFEERFQLDKERSLSAIATGTKCVHECVQFDSEGLAMIPVGRNWEAGGTAGTVARLLREAASDHDMIFFDAPPLLESADARRFEVIVIDNCSVDKAESMIAEMQAWVPFRIVYRKMERNGGCFHSLNVAAEMATTEILASLDSDTWADPNWLKRGIEAFE